MPEIKHNFTGGKMNKDLDERLVPNGEYTDAMNIQVSTSEGSEVGTVQNILGNKVISSSNIPSSFGDDAITVGSITDEKNDRLYYLVWTPTTDYVLEYSRGDSEPVPVLVDINKNVLKFNSNTIITGINIIDDMLFWTDNNTEPKKINILRCKQGTSGFTTHTKLINEDQSLIDVPIEEKHITVIKKAPRKPLDMVVYSSRDHEKIYTGVFNIVTAVEYDAAISAGGTNPSSFKGEQGTETPRIDFRDITTEEGSNEFNLSIQRGILGSTVVDGNTTPSFSEINELDGLTGWHHDSSSYGNSPPTLNNIPLGTKVAIKAFDEDGNLPGLPVTDYNIKGVIEDYWPTIPALGQDLGGDTNTTTSIIKVRATSIDGFPPIPTDGNHTLDYVIDLWDEEEKLFEFKFPRFSYRYKFEDGEYSPFAPFTQVAFLPGSFDYHPRKGYNLGMTNRAFKIELNRIITVTTPKDVVEIDILFKDEPSPSIYVVDTIRPDEYASSGLNNWQSILGDWKNDIKSSSYTITKESIQKVVPSNQLLRPWDNVPRKALAQDVTGNRIVYGNYLQNYNLKTESQKDYIPNFVVSWVGKAVANSGSQFVNVDGLETVSLVVNNSGTAKSIKSLREYQLGVVFTDEYGRETPVISNKDATLKLEKDTADKSNSIKVTLQDYASKPMGLTHLKFFIKETSGEYYNMAMDRFYDAEDGNVWLSFPSSDRDKIDIDTFIILKKGSDQDALVSAAARYKVIAIENEAPDFIKTTRLLAASKTHLTGGGNDLFNTSIVGNSIPVIGKNEFKMAYGPWGNGPGRNLDKIAIDETLYVEFSDADGRLSDRYKITSMAHNDEGSAITPSSPTTYSVQLEEVLKDDVNFISNDTTGANSTSINSTTTVNIYKYKVENKPQFDGRFFVKIYEDEVFASNIGESFIEGLEYRTVSTKKIYSMKGHDDHIDLHWTDTNTMLTSEQSAYSIPASDLTSSAATDFWWESVSPTNVNTDDITYNYGYYLIDEFASMACYFRKMKKQISPLNHAVSCQAGVVGVSNWASWQIGRNAANTNFVWHDIVHLQPLPSSVNAIEYPKGEYWGDAGHWEKEYGTLEHEGHTARWRMDKSGGYIYSGESPRDLPADNPINTDVWFIDFGPAAANRASDSLNWIWWESEVGHNTLYNQYTGSGVAAVSNTGDFAATGNEDRDSDPGGYVDQSGLNSGIEWWNMFLSYGGIAGSGTTKDDYNQYGSLNSFFNIGGWMDTPDLNPYYQSNSKNTGFIKAIAPGEKFRWKEDPTETIYTMSASIHTRNCCRHSARKNNIVARGHSGAVSGLLGGNAPYVWYDWQDIWSGGAVAMAEDLSFNFTAGFKINKITPPLVWDPTTDGQISGGLEITLVAVDSGGGGGTNTCTGGLLEEDLSLYVDSLIGNTTSGDPETATLHVGMALYKYTTQSGGVDNLLQTNLSAAAQEFLVVREIIAAPPSGAGFQLKLGGYRSPLKELSDHTLATIAQPGPGTNLIFTQVGMNGYSHNSEFNINMLGREWANIGAVGAVGYHLDFIEYIEPEAVLSENPAIWETEPKEIKDLDIYYEAGPAVPLTIDASNIHDAVPVGSVIEEDVASPPYHFLVVDHSDLGEIIIADGAGGIYNYVVYYSLWDLLGSQGKRIRVTRPDGLIFKTEIQTISNFQLPNQGTGDPHYGKITILPELYNREFTIPYHNCYSFGNGVESNRIRDNFNLPYISNGVRVSTTLETKYEEERRKYGLIYSGIYNSTGGVNNLNQFIQAEKITKDINPIYGSIQKLHSRDTDLVTLCEDKILRILANKDAVYNADGNPQLTATENVLGQTVPFSGEYGISTNPESFASEAYRAYFSDRVRGTVMRLSKDGLTAVSDHGMKDWFRDNLKLSNKIIGSYDDRSDEYNILLTNDHEPYDKYVLSFREDVRGWVSFKSFTDMQLGMSMANDYYTFERGNLWRHHDETVDRNIFYNTFTSSSVEVVLNDYASSIKDFHTLNYEGSQSKISKFIDPTDPQITSLSNLPFQPSTIYSDQEVYNMSPKDGWSVESITTDKEIGYISEFIEKEGKWFNNINRLINLDLNSADTGDFTFQGIGEVNNAIVNQTLGCIDPNATNYNASATHDDGSCLYGLLGCMDATACNYDANASIDDGSCDYLCAGCTDPNATNYDILYTIDDGSCNFEYFYYGGTDTTAGRNNGSVGFFHDELGTIPVTYAYITFDWSHITQFFNDLFVNPNTGFALGPWACTVTHTGSGTFDGAYDLGTPTAGGPYAPTNGVLAGSFSVPTAEPSLLTMYMVVQMLLHIITI